MRIQWRLSTQVAITLLAGLFLFLGLMCYTDTAWESDDGNVVIRKTGWPVTFYFCFEDETGRVLQTRVLAFGLAADVSLLLGILLGSGIACEKLSRINANVDDGYRDSVYAYERAHRVDAGDCVVRPLLLMNREHADDVHHGSANAHAPFPRVGVRVHGVPSSAGKVQRA